MALTVPLWDAALPTKYYISQNHLLSRFTGYKGLVCPHPCQITRTAEVKKWENWLRHLTSSLKKEIFLFFPSVLSSSLSFTKNGNNLFWCHKEVTPVQWRLGGSCSYSPFTKHLQKNRYPWYANHSSGCPVLDANGRMGSRNCINLCTTEQLASLMLTAGISTSRHVRHCCSNCSTCFENFHVH